LFTEFNLGTWDQEHENLSNFYVLNHKKYAYTDEEGEIQVKAGGVPNNAFNRDMSFKEFIETQFSDGVEINNLKSIYNKNGTISIYPSTTKLEVGKGYRLFSITKFYEKMKEQLFQALRNEEDERSEERRVGKVTR